MIITRVALLASGNGRGDEGLPQWAGVAGDERAEFVPVPFLAEQLLDPGDGGAVRARVVADLSGLVVGDGFEDDVGRHAGVGADAEEVEGEEGVDRRLVRVRDSLRQVYLVEDAGVHAAWQAS